MLLLFFLFEFRHEFISSCLGLIVVVFGGRKRRTGPRGRLFQIGNRVPVHRSTGNARLVDRGSSHRYFRIHDRVDHFLGLYSSSVQRELDGQCENVHTYDEETGLLAASITYSPTRNRISSSRAFCGCLPIFQKLIILELC